MKSVVLQVGHYQIEGITSEGLRSWRSSSVLKKSTGASGERDWHWDKLIILLRDKLIKAGVQVHIADATYQASIYSQEYDLWISLHYDGGGENERCMISAPSRDTKPSYLQEEAQQKSEKFCEIWKELYPKEVGVPFSPNHIGLAMRDYYAFDYVGYDTPAVIIEHFNHTSPKGKELKKNPELVAEADCKAILKFLEIVPHEEDTKYKLFLKGQEIRTYENDPQSKIEDLEIKIKSANTVLENANKQILELHAQILPLQTAIQQQQSDNQEINKLLTEERTKSGGLNFKLKETQKAFREQNDAFEKLKKYVESLDDPLKKIDSSKLIAEIINRLLRR